MASLTLEQRFWTKVVKGDFCWNWTAATFAKGYGAFQGKIAPRVAWELTHGPIPAGLWVLHHCDNPRCVRPDHLFLGDHAANTQDMVSKQRGKKSASHRPDSHAKKLTAEDVQAIRQSVGRGMSSTDIAKSYNVTSGTIRQILTGRTWKHLDSARPRMTRDELIACLRGWHGANDPEVAHIQADQLLLDYISDPEITEAFEAVQRWAS